MINKNYIKINFSRKNKKICRSYVFDKDSIVRYSQDFPDGQKLILSHDDFESLLEEWISQYKIKIYFSLKQAYNIHNEL